MLNWFAGRVEEARDEHGFTLIELLVVITLLFRQRYRSPCPRPSSRPAFRQCRPLAAGMGVSK